MPKVSLIAAINAATFVVCDSYEVDEFFPLHDGESVQTGIELRMDDVRFVFDDQEVELDEVEGVVSATDREGDTYDISLSMRRPLSAADIPKRA